MGSAGSFSLDIADDLCAQEPIHAPGTIQAHGALIALKPGPELLVVAASQNAADFLGTTPLGQRLDGFAAPDFVQGLQTRLAGGSLDPSSPWEVAFPLSMAQDGLEATVHAHGGLVLIELERVQPNDGTQARIASRQLQRWIGHLRAASGSLEELTLVVCQGIREITSYERVLVYRFDPHWNGQAIAEDKDADWQQSLNGLHFPASDIPAQARALYHRSLLRWVVARDAAPIPLFTAVGQNLAASGCVHEFWPRVLMNVGPPSGV